MFMALLAGLFSGVLGSMGLGGGTVLIIYLVLIKSVPQLKAQGINLLFFIPIALISVIIYALKGQIKWKITLKLAFWGALGVVIGWLSASVLGAELVAKAFGGLLIFMGAKEIFAKGTKTLAEKQK